MEVCEKLLTNNYSISISHTVHYIVLLCLFYCVWPIFAKAMLRRLSTGGFRECKQNAGQTGKDLQQNGGALC